ncbi:MAG: phospho-N-acetylmuramoyl-pentapeptide-transferase, partial [Lachnospiraceae bacterium]|nr:phospho-N-acetylmuramoyl-pentapeptide-transferase [Lachnospiraceae bacterium]
MNLELFWPVLAGFLLTVLLMPVLIPLLHKLKFGQQVRKEGIQAHLKKQGTPTMGGIG